MKQLTKKNNTICVGLDADITKIPLEFSNLPPSKAITLFLKEIIKLTSEHAAAFKIQKAFLDLHGGPQLLKNIVETCHMLAPGKPVFVDCKIGDIENTMDIYLKNIFDYAKADGVVVNPFMGYDVLNIIKRYPNKIILVLVRTSNKGAKIMQDIKIKSGNIKLWEYLLNLLSKKFGNNKNVIPIISQHVDVEKIRKIIPQHMTIFYAGIGAQGGDLKKISYLFNDNMGGVIINSSRAILYPYRRTNKEWRKKVFQSVQNLNTEINKIRDKKMILLIGVSGVGKSLLIRTLISKFPKKYKYARPYTTRKLREESEEKIQVHKSTFFKLVRNKSILCPNRIYDNYYGPAKGEINKILMQHRLPILDWPLNRINNIESETKGINFIKIYILPPDIKTLKKRLSQDDRDIGGERYKKALTELKSINKKKIQAKIDFFFRNSGDIVENAIKIDSMITGKINEK